MSDSDSDEDLKRAIALSLEEASQGSAARSVPVIDLTSDDEDDDLDAPVTTKHVVPIQGIVLNGEKGLIKPSTADSGIAEAIRGKGQLPSASDHTVPATNLHAPAEALPTPSSISPLAGISGMNRKQMEEERLARAVMRKKRNGESPTEPIGSRKRKASASPPPSQSQDTRQTKMSLKTPSNLAGKDVAINGALPRLPTHETNQPGTQKEPSDHTKPYSKLPEFPSYKEQQKSLGASGIKYPDGVVKRTWAYGFPRQPDDIKFEEVLQKNDLELAVLSAFQVDPDWVITKLDPRTKVIWVLQAKDEAQKQQYRSTADPEYRFCFPSMAGQINCMHSKLQLLSHPTHLRVVVPSANLVPYDWGETGVMENVCFLIDLPRLPEGRKAELEYTTHFEEELFYFLNAMGLEQSIIGSLRKFDFCRTAHLAFVHSIGGCHTGTNWKRTGYCGLASSVQRLGLQTNESLEVVSVAASIGNLNDSFIKSMYLALQGDDGVTEYGWRDKKPARDKEVTETERNLSRELKSRFRIYFPTRETVAQSNGGIGMIFVRPCGRLSSGSAAWAYVGSANLSESAWGRLVKNKFTKEPKLNCRNWECGVIVPVSPAQSATPEAINQGPPGMEIFQGYVPVPMLVPGEEYGSRRPWFYSERVGGPERMIQ